MKGFLGTLFTVFIIWLLLSGNAQKAYDYVKDNGLKHSIERVWEGK